MLASLPCVTRILLPKVLVSDLLVGMFSRTDNQARLTQVWTIPIRAHFHKPTGSKGRKIGFLKGRQLRSGHQVHC